MPLSEQEQRLLEEMERSLYQNDSDFVARVTRRVGRPTYTSITLGVLVALAGVAAVIVGLALRQPWIGIGGFVLMLLGVLWALRPGMRVAGRAGSQRARSSRSNGRFMDRMNDRWDKRNQQN
ncbi:DUF3040 domain-containing protein [Curtobacterium ammoniigenes]|uniref:DUF3040 domain-containing protein n=1 Tax=Curtobacterium ammoniigenes TaxID=395387 RepID=UPI00082B9F5C|nr:DUF3040 domain-containing protein [Curtobacterium ammoniigenes]